MTTRGDAHDDSHATHGGGGTSSSTAWIMHDVFVARTTSCVWGARQTGHATVVGSAAPAADATLRIHSWQ